MIDFKSYKITALICAMFISVAISYPVMAVVEVGGAFGGDLYTNLGSKITLTLSFTTKGNNSKKQSCGRTYMNIGAANMKITDVKIGQIPNSTIEKTNDGTYIIQNSSKYDCIPDGTHLAATFTAETINTGEASIYSTNGNAMVANITTPLNPKTIIVYPAVCPEGKTGMPPNCAVMGELPDVCPNIGGTQTVVPSNMKKDEAGDCIGLSGGSIEEPGDGGGAGVELVSLASEEKDKTGSIGQVGYFSSIDSIFLQWYLIEPISDMVVLIGQLPDASMKQIDSRIVSDTSMASLTIDQLGVYEDYKIHITGKNSKGEVVKYSGVARTRGYPVEIIIKQSNTSKSGAKVTVAGKTLTTDASGSTKFEVKNGKLDVVVEIDGVKETHQIDVKKIPADESTGVRERQDFLINIASQEAIPVWLYVVIAGFLVVIGVLLGLVVHRHNRRKHFRDSVEYQNTGVPPTIQPPYGQNQ